MPGTLPAELHSPDRCWQFLTPALALLPPWTSLLGRVHPRRVSPQLAPPLPLPLQ